MVWRRILLVLIMLIVPVHATGQTKILNIRHWSAPDHMRVVIDMSGEPRYTVEKHDHKVGIEFADTSLPPDFPHELSLHKPGIERITVISLPEGMVKVELRLDSLIKVNVFTLRKFEEKFDRVVVDIALPEVERQESEARQNIKSSKREKIVIIDPGHGGDDPGAVGQNGTYEKTAVLDIGRKLREVLNSTRGFRAFLTRDGDYYVSFGKRLKIAREYGADLFLSIHADAARNRIAKGSSVYCLSGSGASSEAAKLLARKENLADIIGGSGEEENGNGESAPIILSMYQTSTLNQSKQFGGTFLRHLDKVGDLKFKTVQAAPFRVLKLPDIPSLLVETAYISNPDEERLLRNNRFKVNLVQAMAIAVGECLSASPGTILAMKTQTEKMNKRIPAYRVKKGDTLCSIAVKHGTTASALLKLNHMKLNDPLFVGRVVRLPSTSGDEEEVDGPVSARSVSAPVVPAFVYTVKKGDTIASIARKNDITISALLKLNRMKLQDTLYTGTTLRVREDRRNRVKTGDT